MLLIHTRSITNGDERFGNKLPHPLSLMQMLAHAQDIVVVQGGLSIADGHSPKPAILVMVEAMGCSDWQLFSSHPLNILWYH